MKDKMNSLRVGFLVAAILGVGVASFPQSAGACSYIFRTPEEKFESSDAVFFGTVTDATTTIKAGINNYSSTSESITSFEVEKYWKGEVPKNVPVESSHLVGFSCSSFRGEVGEEYLVYASYSTSTGKYYASEVGPKKATIKDSEVKALGKGKVPVAEYVPIVNIPLKSPEFIFTRNLSVGMSGDDVRNLQKYLNSHGFIVSVSGVGSLGNEGMYFGPATKAALIKFQNAHAKELGITQGTGYFGPLTRVLINLPIN